MKLLSKEIVVQEAIDMINRANSVIRATELLSDKPSSTPVEYLKILHQKIQSGVELRRVLFGTDAQYARFTKDLDFTHERYTSAIAECALYQRMLIVDNIEMLFAIEKPGLQLFFHTDQTKIVTEFSNYFDDIFGKSV